MEDKLSVTEHLRKVAIASKQYTELLMLSVMDALASSIISGDVSAPLESDSGEVIVDSDGNVIYAHEVLCRFSSVMDLVSDSIKEQSAKDVIARERLETSLIETFNKQLKDLEDSMINLIDEKVANCIEAH